jgi:hypothetical protein
MIRLTPVLAGTALVVTGAFGFEEFKHQDATSHSHQERAGTVDNLTGQSAMTRVSSGPMTDGPPTAYAGELDIQRTFARSEWRMKALNARSTPSKIII